jgi:hypothetical protein
MPRTDGLAERKITEAGELLNDAAAAPDGRGVLLPAWGQDKIMGPDGLWPLASAGKSLPAWTHLYIG